MNESQGTKGLSTGLVVGLSVGGAFLAMFVLCCGGCLMLPAWQMASESAAQARRSPAEREQFARDKQAELVAFELSLLSNRAHKEVRKLLKSPSTARFEHPRGGGFGLHLPLLEE